MSVTRLGKNALRQTEGKPLAKEGVKSAQQGSVGVSTSRAYQVARNSSAFIDGINQGINQNVFNGAFGAPPTNIVKTPSTASTFARAEAHYGQEGTSPNVTGRIQGAAELAQFVWAGYNQGSPGPVSIVPATLSEGGSSRPVHLVGISGTEQVDGQSTSWGNNGLVSFGAPNPMFANAKAAILASVPPGSELVLAGHSQGGWLPSNWRRMKNSRRNTTSQAR
jgi:hypothetical protein